MQNEKLNKLLTITALITAMFFVVSIFFLTVQVYNNSGTDSATILSGVLSMLGGALGAIGAYLVARHQMNAQKRATEKENQLKSRPIITCTELHNVYQDLSNIHYSRSAILLGKTVVSDKNLKGSYYVIQFIGHFNMVLNITIELMMKKDGETYKYSIGGVKQDNEILLSLPMLRYESGQPFRPEQTDKIIIRYTTDKQEEIKYIYDNLNNNESYHLISKGKEKLIDKFTFESGLWKVPGRYKND